MTDVDQLVTSIRQHLAIVRQAGYSPDPAYADLYALEQLVKRLQLEIAALEEKVGALEALPDPAADDVGQWQANHPETARDAALHLYPNSGTKRLDVLLACRDANGLCDEQGEDLLRMLHQTYSARRWELVKYGWLEDSGRRHLNRSGEASIIWVPTLRARREWANGR